MKSLIITVAGTATRFNKDTASSTLKCLYHESGGPRHSLLYQILTKSSDIDHFIVVGGYLYDLLCQFIDEHCKGFLSKITLVYNDRYTEGSGYSLIKGVEYLESSSSEVIFVEGDLFFSEHSYNQVISSTKNVITVSNDIIKADKSVAIYVDVLNKLHYVYDTNHQSILIDKPFKAIYHSAQIWKFRDIKKLNQIINNLSIKEQSGTNLVIIEQYFSTYDVNDLDIIVIDNWHNCNTVADYKKIKFSYGE